VAYPLASISNNPINISVFWENERLPKIDKRDRFRGSQELGGHLGHPMAKDVYYEVLFDDISV
jgi:hypothetical protein